MSPRAYARRRALRTETTAECATTAVDAPGVHSRAPPAGFAASGAGSAGSSATRTAPESYMSTGDATAGAAHTRAARAVRMLARRRDMTDRFWTALRSVRADDAGKQTRKALDQVVAAHLRPPLTARCPLRDDACLPQHPEVVGRRGLRNRQAERAARPRRFVVGVKRPHDREPNRVRECLEHGLEAHVLPARAGQGL